MVGLAFEVHDTAKLKKSSESVNADESLKLQFRYQGIHPSFLDIMLYAYCYIGMLTGKCYVQDYCQQNRLCVFRIANISDK